MGARAAAATANGNKGNGSAVDCNNKGSCIGTTRPAGTPPKRGVAAGAPSLGLSEAMGQ